MQNQHKRSRSSRSSSPDNTKMKLIEDATKGVNIESIHREKNVFVWGSNKTGAIGPEIYGFNVDPVRSQLDIVI